MEILHPQARNLIPAEIDKGKQNIDTGNDIEKKIESKRAEPIVHVGDSECSLHAPQQKSGCFDPIMLGALKSYLHSNDAGGILDEDHIISIVHNTEQRATQRHKYRKQLEIRPTLDADSYEEFYIEEEEYNVSNHLLKEIVTEIHDRFKISLDKRAICMLKKILGLQSKNQRYSLELACSNDLKLNGSEDNEVFLRQNISRRYTRGMARSSKTKRTEVSLMENNDLNYLLQAIQDFEKDDSSHTGEMINPEKNNVKRISQEQNDDTKDVLCQSSKRNKYTRIQSNPLIAELPADKRPATRRSSRSRVDKLLAENRRTVRITRILVNGKHVAKDDFDEMELVNRRRDLKRQRDREYQQRKRKRDQESREKKSSEIFPQQRVEQCVTLATGQSKMSKNSFQRSSPKISTGSSSKAIKMLKSRLFENIQTSTTSSDQSMGQDLILLKFLDWQRRQTWSPMGRKLKIDTERESDKKVRLPQTFARLGISFSLPLWENVSPASTISSRPNRTGPVRARHSDIIYASWCNKLLNCLRGSTRSWAMHEFFYSDIDRSWYDISEFAADIARLGILPGMTLSRREWRFVRRRINKRPRRFSKQFISEQLEDRDRHRRMVRHFRKYPEKAKDISFDIPSPIRVGGTVTAFNKKFLTLHRGIVLFHDVAGCQYLIQFERKEFGYEFCPDTEVASHGIPEILIGASEKTLSGSSHSCINKHLTEMGSLPYGTSFGPLNVANTETEANVNDELAKLLKRNIYSTGLRKAVNSNFKSFYRRPNDQSASDLNLIEKVAEREALVSLMSTIQSALSRKAIILNLMEEFNAQMAKCLPSGNKPLIKKKLSLSFEKHYAWLLANLELTNRSLDAVLPLLQIMYGKSYASSLPDFKRMDSSSKDRFLESCLQKFKCDSGSLRMPWIFALSTDSHNTGNTLALSLDGESQELFNGNIRGQLSAAAGLLLSVCYCYDRTRNCDDKSPPISIFSAIPHVLNSGLEGMLPKTSQKGIAFDAFYNDAVSSRRLAEMELSKAFERMKAEFAVINLSKKIDSPHV